MIMLEQQIYELQAEWRGYHTTRRERADGLRQLPELGIEGLTLERFTLSVCIRSFAGKL